VFGKLCANRNENNHFTEVFLTKGNPQRHVLIKAKPMDAGPALEELLRMNAGSVPAHLAFEVANAAEQSRAIAQLGGCLLSTLTLQGPQPGQVRWRRSWTVRNVTPPIWVACCIAAWLRHLFLPSESKISQPFNSLAAPSKPFQGRLLYSSLVANRGADGEKKKRFSHAAPPSSLVPHSWDGGNLDTLLTSLRGNLGATPVGICSSA